MGITLDRLLDFYSPWAAAGCVVLILLFAWTPVFRYADSPPSFQPRRIATVDGLRGFLALAVAFHHAAIYHLFLREGIENAYWVTPPSRFYAAVGPVGVSMFFMITGYLFWSRLIQEDGRPGWVRLYVGRVFRIGPLYLAALGAASLCDWLSRVPVQATLAAQWLATWTMLGLYVYRDRHQFLAGVTWSIQDEWLFYLSLPVLAIFLMRWRRFHSALSLVMLAVPLGLVATDSIIRRVGS